MLDFGVTQFDYKGKTYRWSLDDEVYWWVEADDECFYEVPEGAENKKYGLLS